MRTWPADHPKAKLLDRKREAILAAARRQFLAHGYGGTSMEAIAADAGVSIMTLYRHAERKDELFEAVISIACGDDEEMDAAAIAATPLRELLVASAIVVQDKLLSPDTIALLRAVISEHDRFPDLAAVAFRAVIGHVAEFTSALLADRPETRALNEPKRRELAAAYSDRLFGADILAILLGLSARTGGERRRRAEQASDELMSRIG